MPSLHATSISTRPSTTRNGLMQQMGASMRLHARKSPVGESQKSDAVPATITTASCSVPATARSITSSPRLKDQSGLMRFPCASGSLWLVDRLAASSPAEPMARNLERKGGEKGGWGGGG